MIVDVELPEMNGIELQRLLLTRSNAVPIIFNTARIYNNLRSQALRDRAFDFFHKPFIAEAPLAAVQTAVARSRHR